MKNNKTTILVFVLLVIAAGLFRVFDRPLGFAPQIAMALFAGSVISNRKLSFLLPLASMLISDILYQFLYVQGLTEIPGFYTGQWVNYVLFTAITVIGFFIRKNNITHILLGSLAGVFFFYLTSNFFNWIGGGLNIFNEPYPKTFDGLMSCFAAGIPFLRGSLIATLFFNTIFFGCYYLYTRRSIALKHTI